MREPDDDDARRIRELEQALTRERRRSTELEQRARVLEEGMRRAYKMAFTPARPRDED
ncbi:MAG: hypothetical protein ABIS06_03655 [Vicinamibacterales bacterium]